MFNFARVRGERNRLGLTQGELGVVTGLGKDTISRIENGRQTNPRLSTLQKLAKGLCLKISDLIIEPKSRDIAQ